MSVELAAGVSPLAGAKLGTVVAVCFSPDHPNGIFKQPRASASFTRFGVVGDRHYDDTFYNRAQDIKYRNTRPVTVVSAEATSEACALTGIPDLKPGDLGENLLIEGLGNLSEFALGDMLRVYSPSGDLRVELVVLRQNDPCEKLRQYHRLLTKNFYARRGLICVPSVEGLIEPGDKVVAIRGETNPGATQALREYAERSRGEPATAKAE